MPAALRPPGQQLCPPHPALQPRSGAPGELPTPWTPLGSRALTAGLFPVATQTARDSCWLPSPVPACGRMRWSVGLGGSREGPALAEMPSCSRGLAAGGLPARLGPARISTGILTPPSSLPVRPSALSTGPGRGGPSGLWVGLRAAVGSWGPCSPRQAVGASGCTLRGGPPWGHGCCPMFTCRPPDRVPPWAPSALASVLCRPRGPQPGTACSSCSATGRPQRPARWRWPW